MPLSEHMRRNGSLLFAYLKNSAETDLAAVSSASPGSPVNYEFVSAGKYTEIVRVMFVGSDNSTAVPNTFFGASALTNGLLIQALNGSDVVQQHFGTDDVPITEHHTLASLAGNDIDRDTSANQAAIDIRWTIDKAGKPVLLQPGWKFRVVVRDALDALVDLRVMVQGAQSSSYEFRS